MLGILWATAGGLSCSSSTAVTINGREVVVGIAGRGMAWTVGAIFGLLMHSCSHVVPAYREFDDKTDHIGIEAVLGCSPNAVRDCPQPTAGPK